MCSSDLIIITSEPTSSTYPIDIFAAHRRLGAWTDGAGKPSQYASARESGAKRAGLSNNSLVIGLCTDAVSHRSLLERKVPSHLKKLLTTSLCASVALGSGTLGSGILGSRVGDALSADGGGKGNDGEESREAEEHV